MNTNKPHFSEADLLETYYTKPGESMPVMMHLASCDECAARYERLERKLRDAAACPTEPPDGFWSRQRASIMGKVQATHPTRGYAIAPARVAAAALLAFVLGGTTVYEFTKSKQPPPPIVVTQTVAQPAVKSGDELQLAHDPWQSEELKDFEPIVQWESWMNEGL
ncbi:MAG: anti-sigma factor family protein [Thermoanaerobaculia bacterium]